MVKLASKAVNTATAFLIIERFQFSVASFTASAKRKPSERELEGGESELGKDVMDQ